MALELLLLTVSRTEEIILAKRLEIDLDAKCWTRPAEHMKGKIEHRVPLSDQAVLLLRDVFARWPNSRYLFPGRYGREGLSQQAMLMLMRRLNVPSDVEGRPAVPHGLRCSFRDWGTDNRWPDDVLERALAHVELNKTKAAYKRSDLYEARQPPMQAWADFVYGKNADDT